MTVSDFLADLARRDVVVTADGDALRCNAPAGALTPALRDDMRRRKAEIVAFLRRAEALARQQRAIVPLQPRGDRDPIFAIGGHNGDVFCYRPLAAHLGSDQPFYGLQPPGLESGERPLDSVEELAAHFAAEIRAFRPGRPCIVAGYCAGATIAFELARQLAGRGPDVHFVALLAGPHPHWYRRWPQVRHRVGVQAGRLFRHARALAVLPPAGGRAYLAAARERRAAEAATRRAGASDPELQRRVQLGDATLAAVRRHTPAFYGGRVALLLPSAGWRRGLDALLCRRWRPLASEVDEFCGPKGCTGDQALQEPAVGVIAEQLRQMRDRRHGHPRPTARAASAVPARA